MLGRYIDQKKTYIQNKIISDKHQERQTTHMNDDVLFFLGRDAGKSGGYPSPQSYHVYTYVWHLFILCSSVAGGFYSVIARCGSCWQYSLSFLR